MLRSKTTFRKRCCTCVADETISAHSEDHHIRLSARNDTWLLSDSKFARDNSRQREPRSSNGHCKCLFTAIRCSSNQNVGRTYVQRLNSTAELSPADIYSRLTLQPKYVMSSLSGSKWFRRKSYLWKSSSFIINHHLFHSSN
jgi:hypothetical protein